MPRGRRMLENGGYYHVIQRGNNKEYIFESANDKGYLLELLKQIQNELPFSLYAYVIMDNHYHLLLKPDDRTRLNELMQKVNSRFARYYNWQHKRSGHVFQGRYKSILITEERYLFAVLRYIHQNPVRAGICSKVEDYRWSSDWFYRHGQSSFVDCKFILQMLADESRQAIKLYRDLLKNNEDSTNYENFRVLGELKTCETIPNKKIINQEVMGNPVQRPTLDSILKKAAQSEKDFLLIKNASRERHLTPKKVKYIKAAQAAGYTFQEIGANIGMSGVAVYKLQK
ncbi:MAG TPA: hypothetical protein GXZ75_02175 [Clostridia bacterium]|nr:hypothetical protein [Clostridia bacterium]